jgi:hypothetical protein
MEIDAQKFSNENVTKLNVSEQVAFDIKNYFGQFPNKSFAQRILSKETGLNSKTIKRLLKCTNKPTYQTLFRLYSVMLSENDFEQLCNLCPENIAEQIRKYSPCNTVTTKDDVDDFLDLVRKDALMSELYVLAGTGPLKKSAVGFRYGQYGIELIERFVEKKYFNIIDTDTYILSDCAPNLDTDSLKHLGEYFVSKFSKPKNAQVKSENTISFYAESLNEEGKKAWLAIDTESFYKKVEIANNPLFKGNEKIFTFTATDSIKTENQYV